jgi:hypothetical protein
VSGGVLSLAFRTGSTRRKGPEPLESSSQRPKRVADITCTIKGRTSVRTIVYDLPQGKRVTGELPYLAPADLGVKRLHTSPTSETRQRGCFCSGVAATHATVGFLWTILSNQRVTSECPICHLALMGILGYILLQRPTPLT